MGSESTLTGITLINKTYIPMKKVILSFILAALVSAMAGQQAELLKDINYGSESSYIIYMTQIPGKVVFKATNYRNTNNEPWVTDGTADGTFMLKEINPSTITGSSTGPMVVYKNEAYFSADDGTHGSELWKTNGTPEGTVMVRDIAPGSTGSKPGYLTVWNNILYFSAYHPDTGTELWKTEGTTETTFLVKDLTEGSASTQPGYITTGKCGLYFNGLSNLKLFFSDGTSGGTVLISDQVRVGQLDEAYFTEFRDEMYFRASDLTSGTGSQLWKVAGSSALRVTGIVDGTTQLDPRYLTVVGDKMYFVGEKQPFGRELWVYDDAGIHMVKDINPDGHGNLSGGFFTGFRGKLVFSAGVPSTGVELWVSDGTDAGTKMVKDIWPGIISSGVVSPVNLGDTLYFSANDATGGELWRLLSPDGQPEKFTSIENGGAWGPELKCINKIFIFNASTNSTGDELWKMTVSGSTAAESPESAAIKLKVYPNPAACTFTVEIPECISLPCEMSFCSMTGSPIEIRKVTDRIVTVILQDDSETRPGIYIIKSDDGRKTAFTKLLIL
jgi:ELWxxDGT repeat protein